MTQKSIIIVGLALLAAVIIFSGATGEKVPLLSNVRVDVVLLIIGMTRCTPGRIGRILRLKNGEVVDGSAII